MSKLRFLVRSCILCLVLVASADRSAAVDIEPFAKHDPAAVATVDHGPWAEFLLRYLRIGPDGVHRIGYGRVTARDRALLDNYIDHLTALEFARLSRPEQIATWINLYNALVVRLVIEHYPIGRITDIEPPSGPFGLPLVDLAGQRLSLRDIEERILLPLEHDPRILYALSCGAIGCPNLQVEPFRGRRLEQQLNAVAMAFINDPRCVRIEGDRLILSSLFRWQGAAFGVGDRAIIRHLMAFAEPELAMDLQRFERVTDYVFDWRLNDATLM
jgi:hypothetical protein